MSDVRKISKEDYLKALACFVMTNDLYQRGRTFERMLNKTLGLEADDMGTHFGDAIYGFEKGSVEDFDAALRKSDLEVEDGQAS